MLIDFAQHKLWIPRHSASYRKDRDSKIMKDTKMRSGSDTESSDEDSPPQEERSSVHEHWIQDALEDDDVREALKRRSALDGNNARSNQGK